MIRIVIDIDGDDALATKEAVAMRLDNFGKVRVINSAYVSGSTYSFTIYIYDCNLIVTKESVMALIASLGNARVVSVDDGRT